MVSNSHAISSRVLRAIAFLVPKMRLNASREPPHHGQL